MILLGRTPEGGRFCVEVAQERSALALRIMFDVEPGEVSMVTVVGVLDAREARSLRDALNALQPDLDRWASSPTSGAEVTAFGRRVLPTAILEQALPAPALPSGASSRRKLR